MYKPFAITAEDSFILTFLAVWISARITTWGVNQYLPLFVLVLAIFLFCSLVSQYRHWLLGGDKKHTGLMFAISLPALIIIILYFSFINSTYLKINDISIFSCILLLWFIIPLIEYFGNKYAITVYSTSQNHQETNTSQNNQSTINTNDIKPST